MCGRYSSSRDPGDLVAEFEIEQPFTDDKLISPDYNVAPTKPVYAVLERFPRDAEGNKIADADPVRRLEVVSWGLVPSWAKDPSIGNKLINARMETVADKPAFRRAFAARRCLLPADGYFEWYAEQSAGRGGKKAPKQPYFIHPKDGGVLAMAGLYEIWRDPTRDRDDPRAWLWTATVLTTTAEDDLGRIHDRSPLLVEPDRYAQWLDPRITDGTVLRDLLVPAAPGRLAAYPVSRAVNDVRNNGPQLLDPIPPDEVVADADAPADDTLF
ncbi:MAG: SOS response-associated peptidase [Sporichthyaceae bacterium]|nr:SOS response-associated peptidase [Sporichthyaceae bacterium]